LDQWVVILQTTTSRDLQIADGALGVDAEDRLHKFVDGSSAGERLHPLSRKACTHQMHDSGLMIALCGQASVNCDAAFIG
jgi:hypothetical protein